jgi:hypothetical protein
VGQQLEETDVVDTCKDCANCFLELKGIRTAPTVFYADETYTCRKKAPDPDKFNNPKWARMDPYLDWCGDFQHVRNAGRERLRFACTGHGWPAGTEISG